MIKKIFLSLLSIVGLLAASLVAYVYLNKSPQLFLGSVAGLYSEEPRLIDPLSARTTDSGQLVGFADAYDTHAWLGIPYAEPPVGPLRWKAPRPAKPWAGKREALEYGSPCVQFWGRLSGTEGENGDLLGSEDCLTLNVWAPAGNQEQALGANKPVMVWIHGGGNDSGTANIYQAHHLAGSKDVVVVLLNYRVGLMGWFSHEGIRSSSDTPADASGNYGTLDIIAGLEWVQQNIKQFGGNPDNVTIFGESAGGRNVYSMLASPLAKGLFHKGIVQSGTADTTLLTLAEDFDDQRLSKASFGLKNSSNGLIELALKQQYPGDSQAEIRGRMQRTPAKELVEMMRATDANTLMTLASANSDAVGYIKVARVLRDGHVIPREPLLSLFQDPSRYNSVPLMLGTNRDEQKVFMARNPEYVKSAFGVLPRIKDLPRYERVNHYVSTNWKAGSVDEPAKRITQRSDQPVYAYRFDWDEEPTNFLVDLSSLLGASHGFEVNYVFGDFKGGISVPIIQDKSNAPGREALALSMMDYWAQFAHTGHPNRGLSGTQTEWLEWQASGNNLMLLDTLADGGTRMAEVRTNVADIKAQLRHDDVLQSQADRCEAYAALFLHGYQITDFWDTDEYANWGCEDYPVGNFRGS